MFPWLEDSFRQVRRRQRLRALLRKLGSALPRRYGLQEHYRIGRIRFTCKLLKIPENLWDAAEAGFASQQQFCTVFHEEGHGSKEDGRGRYRALQKELAAANGGNYRFLPKRRDLADRWENNRTSFYADNV